MTKNEIKEAADQCTAEIMEASNQNDVLVIRTYLAATPSIKAIIRGQINIVKSTDATEEERSKAAATINEVLFP